MANLRTNNLSGEQGQNAIRGSLGFHGSENSTDYLQIGSAGDFNYLHDGTSDWTAEFFVRSDQLNHRQTVFSTGGNSSSIGFACRIMEDGSTGGSNGYKVFCQFSRGASGNYLGFEGGVIDNKDFSHVALVFTTSNKQLAIYINGQLTNSSDLDGTAANTFGSGDFSSSNSTYAFTIGRENFGTTLYMDSGFISNLRIVEGETVYTADFTPPTTELTIIPNTTLLCCQDSNNPTQEATGKTITGFGDLATAGYLKTQPKVIPPYGVDAGNAFGGPIQQSTQGYMCFPTGRTEERGRGRGVLSGGRNDHAMQFVNIQSQGNSQTFGDSITGDGIEGFAVGSSTRGLFSGGYPSVGNVIEFITFATTSNGKDFGDMTTGRRSGAGAGNETRGLFGGGLNSSGTTLNTIEFSTIASLGNSTDFGDMTQARDQLAGLSDTTRAIFAGGVEQGGSQHNIMDFVTIATTGNAQDFGDTSAINHGSSASSDSTRGVIALAYTAPNMINTIEFITIQSAGNSKDFGDLTQAGYLSANMSNSTRAVIAGRGTPSASNTIDFVTIQTTGNANDFGDLIGGANFVVVGTSDSHGGLS